MPSLDVVVKLLQRLLLLLLHLGDAGQVLARDTARVEGSHRELRARLADRLRGDDADRVADLDQPAGRQVAAVAVRADPLPQLAVERRADADLLDARRLDLLRAMSSRDLVFTVAPTPRRSPGGRSCSIVVAALDALGQVLDESRRPRRRLRRRCRCVVPQSMSRTITSCATSTRRRVR